MRIVAFLTDPPVVRQILRHLSLPEHPPPLAPARLRPSASSSPSIVGTRSGSTNRINRW
jgi:hypothetical protein